MNSNKRRKVGEWKKGRVETLLQVYKKSDAGTRKNSGECQQIEMLPVKDIKLRNYLWFTSWRPSMVQDWAATYTPFKSLPQK